MCVSRSSRNRLVARRTRAETSPLPVLFLCESRELLAPERRAPNAPAPSAASVRSTHVRVGCVGSPAILATIAVASATKLLCPPCSEFPAESAPESAPSARTPFQRCEPPSGSGDRYTQPCYRAELGLAAARPRHAAAPR